MEQIILVFMVKTYTHLSPPERDEIAILNAQGISLNNIAMRLKRNRSTISRELHRNKSPIYTVYRSHLAQECAMERKSNAHQPRFTGSTSTIEE